MPLANEKYTGLRSLAIALTVLGFAFAQSPGFADDDASLPYDWVVRIKVEELKKQFTFKGTKLNQMVKAHITYFPVADKVAETKYEEIWFNRGKSIGLDRHTKLKIAKGDVVGIEVVHSTSPTEAERAAAAGAIVRLFLDTYLNGNPLLQVSVPADSFQPICSELQKAYNFTSDQSADLRLQITVCASGTDDSTTLSYEEQ